jgi:hypothetical protein
MALIPTDPGWILFSHSPDDGTNVLRRPSLRQQEKSPERSLPHSSPDAAAHADAKDETYGAGEDEADADDGGRLMRMSEWKVSRIMQLEPHTRLLTTLAIVKASPKVEAPLGSPDLSCKCLNAFVIV